MTKRNALGKGLGAIFTDLVDDGQDKPSLITCGIEELRPNRFQPRKDFEGRETEDLVRSIRQNGIIQPIVVRKSQPGYEIIAGERRWRAAQAAGLKDVPVLVRTADDEEVAELSLIENLQREELNAIEEAEAYQTLMDTFHLTQDQISSKVGKDRSTITNSLRLLKLSADARTALSDRRISAGHARALLAISSKEGQQRALKDIIGKKLSVREAERLAKRFNSAGGKKKTRADGSVAYLEDMLSKKLMTRVTIRRTRKGGTIEIKFSSPEDLNRLSQLLTGTHER